MAQLPADVSPGDGSHDDHHDALHVLYNHMDTVGGGNALAAWTAAEKNKLAAIEAAADVTDTTNVTAAGALMDSEVDADIKTLSLPASTTISTFGATLVDDASAAVARATLDVYSTTEVDDAVAAVSSSSGVTRNTHAHSSSGALAVTRAAADQDTRVTVTANATSFTDNMNDRDIWHLTLVNGTAADYTVDLSGITSWSDTSTSLTAVLDMHQLTVATLLLRKIEGTVYGTLDVVTEGSPQAGPGAVKGYYTAGGVSTPTVAASSLTTAPQNGDGLLFIVVAPGPSASATVNYTAPTSSTQLADYAGSGFSPRIRLYYRTYAGESNWTFGSDSGITRVAVVAFDNLTTFVAGTAGAVLDATSVAHSVAGIGVYIGTAGWDSGNDSTWTNHPASHSLVFDNRASVASQPNMQLQVAALTLSSGGTYDPGPATFGPSVQEYSSFAVAATA